jgi:hypothetical protein
MNRVNPQGVNFNGNPYGYAGGMGSPMGAPTMGPPGYGGIRSPTGVPVMGPPGYGGMGKPGMLGYMGNTVNPQGITVTGSPGSYIYIGRNNQATIPYGLLIKAV